MNKMISNLFGLRKNKIPFGGVTILIVFCMTIYFGLVEYTKNSILDSQLINLAKTGEESYLELQRTIVESREYVNFLNAMPPVLRIREVLQDEDFSQIDSEEMEQFYARLKTIFSAFLRTHPEVRQVRYVGRDNNGKELVRVEKRSGSVFIVPDELLQEKGDTDYYQSTKMLNPSEVFVSSIGLNREYGEVDIPYWPTYRVSQSVYDSEYNFFGFIIVNIDATYLLEKLKSEYQSSNFSLYMLDADGYFIAAPKKSLEFGMDLDKPLARWDEVTDSPTPPEGESIVKVTINGESNYVTTKKIALSNQIDGYLVLVSSLSESTFNELLSNQKKYIVYLVVIIFLAAALMIYGYQQYLNNLIRLYDDQSRYEAIVAGSSDAIINIDSSGNILSWNESASYMFGLNEKRSMGKKISALVPSNQDTVELNDELFNKIIAKNSPELLEIESTNSLGKKQILSVSLSPVAPKDTSIKATVAAMIRDISEARENQEKIVAINDSLEKQVVERTTQLALATDEAVLANETKSMFIANISHEIRTPLNGIGGMLELLARESLTARQNGYLKMAKSSVGTLSVLINDLLDLTKIESGKLDIEMSPLNVVEVAGVIVETMSLNAQEKGLTILFDSSELKHEHVVSDAYRIKQIITNLVGNSIKFTEEGYILVKLASKDGKGLGSSPTIEISVEDTGMGITEEQQNRLFKPFTQADKSIARNYGGTGLGLSISLQLAALLGGTLSVKSVENRGSTFTFSFAPTVANTKNTLVGFSKRPEVRCQIIMLDSKERSILTKQLEAWGVLVSADDSMQRCLNINSQNLPDLLVVDFDLLDGHLEQLKEKLANAGTCKLIVVGTNYPTNQCSGEEGFPCSYIVRPILPFQLYSTYKRLRHPEIAKQKISAMNNLDSDSNNAKSEYHVLIVDDNEINRFVAQGLLEKFPVKTYTAVNGAEAVKLLASLEDVTMDLILMDCQMPVLDGFEATSEIRGGAAGDVYVGITIIALTAGAMAGEREACLLAGMDDFLAKPIDPTVFEAKVTQWLNINAAN